MAVIAIDGHRGFRRCRVDQFFGRQFRWIPFRLVPIAAEQPSALGSFPGALPNTGGDPDAYVPPAATRPDWTSMAALAALTLVLGAGAGYVLGKRTR